MTSAVATTPLNRRELRFVEAYLEGKDLSAAALAGWPELEGRAPTRIWQRGRKTLDKPNVRDALQRTADGALEDTKLTIKRKLLELYMTRAFFNPADIIREDGALIAPLSDLGPLAMAVDGVETKLSKEGEVTVVKLADRMQAAERLQRLLGIAEDKDGGDGRAGVQVIVLGKADMTPDEWNVKFGYRQVEDAG